MNIDELKQSMRTEVCVRDATLSSHSTPVNTVVSAFNSTIDKQKIRLDITRAKAGRSVLVPTEIPRLR